VDPLSLKKKRKKLFCCGYMRIEERPPPPCVAELRYAIAMTPNKESGSSQRAYLDRGVN
jgi:hypothetical protein